MQIKVAGAEDSRGDTWGVKECFGGKLVPRRKAATQSPLQLTTPHSLAHKHTQRLQHMTL